VQVAGEAKKAFIEASAMLMLKKKSKGASPNMTLQTV
jgi:hypothetical protein